MKKFLRRAAAGAILLLAGVGTASAQQRLCYNTSLTSPNCTIVTPSTPYPVTGTLTPSGTQSVNIAQILGAAPSLTNPLWVSPATGAVFPVSGTFTIAEPVTTNAATATLASNLILNAAASSLYTLNVSADSTLSGAAWWIMIFNATTLPADGTVTPARCISMPSGSTAYTGAFPVGLPFSTGIVIGVSTTGCFTKTASIHAYIAGDYK